MRKTLLIAAAALAASIISSQAQVYSQNVVGYANLPAPTGGKDYLIEVPFAVGVSNGVNEVFGTNLPAFSSILIWNGNGYTSYIYDPTNPDSLPGPNVPVWYLGDDATPAVPLPTVPAGEGFFLAPNSPMTNLLAGAVAVNVGTSNNTVFATGGKDYLVGAVVPYAGAITNGNYTTGAGGPSINLSTPGVAEQELPQFTSFLFWNGNGYTAALFDPTNPDSDPSNPPNWYFGDDATPYVDPTTGGNVPNIAVGQGFFISPNSPYTWTVGL